MRILFTLVLASILTGCGRNCASLAEEQLGKKTSRQPRAVLTATPPGRQGSRQVPSRGGDSWSSSSSSSETVARVELIARSLHEVCADTSVERADALVRELEGVLDGYARNYKSVGLGKVERLRILQPFLTAVEGYWIGLLAHGAEADSTVKVSADEIGQFYRIAMYTSDLVHRKIGCPGRAFELEQNVYSALRQMARLFRITGRDGEYAIAAGCAEQWLNSRYDVLEGSALEAECSRIEEQAAQSPDRSRLPIQKRSRFENVSYDLAIQVVGRPPKWVKKWRAGADGNVIQEVWRGGPTRTGGLCRPADCRMDHLHRIR